ncbi:MAG TPA: metallophosphoesterase family protein [Gaiellaceae bacterium]
MRLGLISDLHGNLPALEAVLGELERDGVERIVCLGDVAVGPQPSETLNRIRAVGCPVVMGNWDAAFVDGLPAATDELSQLINETNGWWSEQLTDEDREFIRTFVPTLDLELDGLPVLCCHGSPHSYDDGIFATTPDAELEALFDAARPPLLIAGHTHVQLARRFDASLLVNPGSVGLPFRDWPPKPVRISPWAEYAVVEVESERVRVDLRRTPFDVTAFLRMSRASGMPHAEWWADCWVTE